MILILFQMELVQLVKDVPQRSLPELVGRISKFFKTEKDEVPVTAGRCAEKGWKLLDSYEGMWEVLK
jgi:hypothetical protein